MDAIELQPLGPANLAALLDFFEQRAFVDHPAWRSCYCHFPHADHAAMPWKERSAEHNRAATCERVRAATMHGWLALADGVVVGWCNAGPRTLIAGMFEEPEPLAERLGAIACFVVAPDWRGRGVASRLLDAACTGFAAQGLDWAEAYPRRDAHDAGANHFGPRAMFEHAGFSIVREDGADGLVVRKPLHHGAKV